MEELAGKVVVVTGGASGIGLALTTAFLDQGMRVVMGDIEAAALEKAVADLPAGAAVLPVVADVSRIEDVERLRDQGLDTYGQVDVVCNNAGVAAGGLGWEVALEDWSWVLGVNLMGVVHGVKTFVPLFLEQGSGHVVNTASMAGLLSSPFMAPYNVAKHGVVTLSETIHAELQMLGAPVGVSVLCPGWVKTRIGEADRNRPHTRPGADLDGEDTADVDATPRGAGLAARQRASPGRGRRAGGRRGEDEPVLRVHPSGLDAGGRASVRADRRRRPARDRRLPQLSGAASPGGPPRRRNRAAAAGEHPTSFCGIVPRHVCAARSQPAGRRPRPMGTVS